MISLKFTAQFDHCPVPTNDVIPFNKILFITDFLQGLELCAQKTKVVEMDVILKFIFDLNRCLGTCHNALQYGNTNIPFKMKDLVCFYFYSLEYVIFKYRYDFFFFFFFFFIFGCMGPRLNHKRKTRLKYWFVNTGCLKVMILFCFAFFVFVFFLENFQVCMHIHVKLLQSNHMRIHRSDNATRCSTQTTSWN